MSLSQKIIKAGLVLVYLMISSGMLSACSSRRDQLVKTCEMSSGLSICVYGTRGDVQMSFENMTGDTLHFIGPVLWSTLTTNQVLSYDNFYTPIQVYLSDDNSEILPRIKKSGPVYVGNIEADTLELTYHRFDYPYVGDNTRFKNIYFIVPFER